VLLKPAARLCRGLLAAAGSGGVGSCPLASLPGEDRCCECCPAVASHLSPCSPARPGCHPPWPRAVAGGADSRSVPLEQRALAAGGEKPTDFTAVAARDTASADGALGV